MVFVSFYRIQVEHHAVGRRKLPHQAEDFFCRKLIYHSNVMTDQQRLHSYGLRLVLVLSEMVDGRVCTRILLSQALKDRERS